MATVEDLYIHPEAVMLSGLADDIEQQNDINKLLAESCYHSFATGKSDQIRFKINRLVDSLQRTNISFKETLKVYLKICLVMNIYEIGINMYDYKFYTNRMLKIKYLLRWMSYAL